MDEQLKMLKALTDAKGIPGNERAVRNVFREYIEPLADSFETDGLGSAVAKKVGAEDGPKIMIAGHLDEVGFMVTQIDDKGFIKFQTVGGWVSQVMLAQKVTIVTRSGEEITGVIGSKPPHVMTAAERQKSFDIKDMFIDVGAVDKAEVDLTLP
ncbi:Putative aminopeptidase ysdC [Listeria monocytogenes]|nr:Putative aminopeptidase ysdC [Listeria monocytogenes]